jgi:hypothetical protein
LDKKINTNSTQKKGIGSRRSLGRGHASFGFAFAFRHDYKRGSKSSLILNQASRFKLKSGLITLNAKFGRRSGFVDGLLPREDAFPFFLSQRVLEAKEERRGGMNKVHPDEVSVLSCFLLK